MLSDIDFSVVYASGEREPAEFFLDALCNSNKYDLALGFFSSSGFRALALGFAHFIANGGSMRIIINNILSPEDKLAIERGYNLKPEELSQFDITDSIDKLYSQLSRYDKHFFHCISWLIATHKVEMTAVIPSGSSSGIAHQKFGVFSDTQENKVAFNGSINFSSSAIFDNMETISCYRSWSDDSSDRQRIEYFGTAFNDIWSGVNRNSKIIPIEKVRTFIKNRFSVDTFDQLVDEEELLLEEAIQSGFLSSKRAENYRHKIEQLKRDLKERDKASEGPVLPQNIVLRDYQSQAFRNWEAANYMGLFEMATGTGKTLTALNCAIELYKKEGCTKNIILVPTIPLANQWKEEAQQLHFKNIVMVNSRNTGWQNEVLHLINLDFVEPVDYCLISTYASYNTPLFKSIVAKLSNDTLLIADEAHNFGTERHISNFPYKFQKRIGLTATPARYFDEEGTQAILEYFNSPEEATFRLDMSTAIEKGLLCRYHYYPKIVFLTTDEFAAYRDISIKLVKYYNFDTQIFLDNPIVSSLLLKRKRIINQASEKINCLRQILSELMNKHDPLNYTFVYVPEGMSDLYGVQKTRIIDAYARVISEEFGLRQHQFIGSTKDRNTILAKFARGEISVLTAMKCLDEGVDVKRAEIAIFSASTGNPRQFIQRRGRILRTHEEKKYAVIYDMVVMPSPSLMNFSESIKIEQNLLRKELMRVAEFASISENKYEALNSLQNIAREYGIDVYSVQRL